MDLDFNEESNTPMVNTNNILDDLNANPFLDKEINNDGWDSALLNTKFINEKNENFKHCLENNFTTFINKNEEYFNNIVLPGIIQEYIQWYDDISNEEIKTANTFSYQIKDMELQLTTSQEEGFNDGLGKIILQLQEDEAQEKEKIRKVKEDKIKQLEEKLYTKIENTDSEGKLIKEKLCWDMCNALDVLLS